MPRVRRLNPFLHRRRSYWYLRFRFPASIRALIQRNEFQLSLATRDRQIACERARALYPHVYAIRKLARHMTRLSRDDVAKALRRALANLVADLERTKAPWFAHDPMHEMMQAASDVVSPQSRDPKFMDAATVMKVMTSSKITAAQHAIQNGIYSSIEPKARAVLAEIGINDPEPSPELSTLCRELLKLNALYWQVDLDRKNGDFDSEARYLAPYIRRGYLDGTNPKDGGEQAPTLSAAAAIAISPRLSQAWTEYVAEKTEIRGRAQWRRKTAALQQGTFDEFLEVTGDRPVAEVTRTMIGEYLRAASKLPKNRRLRHHGISINTLLQKEFPEAERLSSRSVSERFTHIAAFLKWCRETKLYTTTNPTIGMEVSATSQSYAPFTGMDLRALFLSDAYLENLHRKSWQFWLPLIALYTGARLGEIAQLQTANIMDEDGVSLIVITDSGDDQAVKTRAAVRKVPLSQQLTNIGLLEYAMAMRAKGNVRLFADLPGGSSTQQRNKMSRWFNEVYKVRCGITADPTGARKVFHSFRHSAITKAVSAGLPIAHCQQVFGHEKTMMGETATYTHEIQPSVLVRVVEALDYGLDHSSYKNGWRNYAAR